VPRRQLWPLMVLIYFSYANIEILTMILSLGAADGASREIASIRQKKACRDLEFTGLALQASVFARPAASDRTPL